MMMMMMRLIGAFMHEYRRQMLPSECDYIRYLYSRELRSTQKKAVFWDKTRIISSGNSDKFNREESNERIKNNNSLRVAIGSISPSKSKIVEFLPFAQLTKCYRFYSNKKRNKKKTLNTVNPWLAKSKYYISFICIETNIEIPFRLVSSHHIFFFRTNTWHQRKKKKKKWKRYRILRDCEKRKYCAIIESRQINEMGNKQKVSHLKKTEKTLAILEWDRNL